jgi:hypothetical protein
MKGGWIFICLACMLLFEKIKRNTHTHTHTLSLHLLSIKMIKRLGHFATEK